MDGFVNLVKLCVGADTVEDLAMWQAERMARIPGHIPCHVTRMWPRRADELLNGGSLYWVFRGAVLARQRIVALEERRGDDGILRCGLMFDPEIIRTEAMPRRAFQGWRYLEPKDSPRDLPRGKAADTTLPRELLTALAEIGLR
ncbi:MAG: DUF1489 domain-containing protein [Albidovulum sp.]